jgi:hypothetical protein
MPGPRNVGRVIGIAAALLGFASDAWAQCAQWSLAGQWQLRQTNGITVIMTLNQDAAGQVSGAATYSTPRQGGLMGPFGARVNGRASGRVRGDVFSFVVDWSGSARGEYQGKVAPDGTIRGSTYDLSMPSSMAGWYELGGKRAICAVAKQAPPPPQASASPNPGPTKQLGRRQWATAINDVDVYEGPSGQTKVLGIMRAGTRSRVSTRQQQWYRLIATAPGLTGWVSADHLKIDFGRP